MEIKILKSLEETDPLHWNSIVPWNHMICSYEQLIGVEKSHINDCDYRYILIYNNGNLIAHTCMYAMSFDLDMFNKGTSKKIIDFVRKHFIKDFLKMKIVECGCPTALGSTITMVIEASRETVLSIISKEMKKFAREMKVNILLLRDFYEEELNVYDFLKFHGFKHIQNLPNSIIVNRWKTFKEYLTDLTAKYRRKILRYLEHLDENNVQVKEVEKFSQYSQRLYELWKETYNRAKEYQREILTPEFFENMDMYLGNRSKVVLFTIGEEIIGFILVLLDDDTIIPLFVGMDYRYVRQTNLYFNFLCYVIKMTIEAKKRFLEIGITSIYHKKDFGAEIIPLYAYMMHLNPLLNMIIPKLFVVFTPPIMVVPKHVFSRRYFERIYTDFKIRFWYKGKEQSAQVNDISESGMRFVSSLLLKKNNGITVEFYFSEDINSFMIPAKVIWTKKLDTECEVGLVFEAIHQPILDRMRDFIKYLRNIVTTEYVSPKKKTMNQ